jgi:ribonucleotide reductase beta subunit family protein with ferritin-like domain
MTNNPFGFMQTIGILNKENFFEVRPDAYQSATNQQNTNSWKPPVDSDSDSDTDSDE